MTDVSPAPEQTLVEEIEARAAMIRRETIRLIEVAKSGHYTSVYSAAEILATLYSGVMRISDDPEWDERDRLILSKGHVAVGVYPLLAERGYLPPELVGVGMAQAARLRGYDATRIWILLGDQELNEGQIWEAAQAAAHFRLGNMCAIVDRNQMGLDGKTEDVMSIEPIRGRFEAFGWRVLDVDGHDPAALAAMLSGLPTPGSDTPTCVIAQTVKGKGVGFMELSRTWHLGYLAPPDAAETLRELEQA
jgi:transketolase